MKVENLEIPERIRTDFLESGIEELNPPQEMAVDAGLLDGRDMVVAAPTASGKTFIAELAMTKQVIQEGRKAVYIVPLKALASEKYQDFSERFENQNVRISVGDLDDSGEGMETADIIVVTSEKLDSILRHNPSWIHEIGLVVSDEVHLLTSENRGPTLEVTITRLRDLLEFQFLGLSATISNSGELADWLDAELVESDYRPVDLEHGIYWQNEVEFFSESDAIEKVKDQEEKEQRASSFSTGKSIKHEENKEFNTEKMRVKNEHDNAVLNILEDTFGREKQAIVFCNSRKGAEKSSDRASTITEAELSREEKSELKDYSERIENVLGSPTTQCKRLAENVAKGAAFHHAGLVGKQRTLVEEAFKKGLIRSISATPTLAAGVNLPAFRVVIRDLKRYTGRGMDFIPVLEYEQMTGRAGRPKYDDRGEAISISKNPGMKEEILERYIAGEPERIQSKLSAEPVLRMHTLSLVASRFCTSMDELQGFYEKTFYAHQYRNMADVESKIEKVVRQLREYGFIEPEEMKPTPIGRRVSELYIDPDSAHHILESLKKAEGSETRPISYLFMLARTTEMTPRPSVKEKEYSDIQKALNDAELYLLEEVPNEWDVDHDLFMQCMKLSMLMQGWISEASEEHLMNEYGVAPGGIRAIMNNADWLLYASGELARMKDFELGNDLKNLRIRLKHGIKEELLKLVQYDQIGRVRARRLYDHGIRDQNSIRDVSFEKLKKLIGKRTGKKLKKQVGEENIFDRENIMDYFD